MTEFEKTAALEIFDEYGVSANKVKSITGLTDAEIDSRMKAGMFPLPVAVLNGMKYWRFGDMARLELGWS